MEYWLPPEPPSQKIRFDLGRDGFTADSPVVAGTAAETADCLAVHLPGRSAAEIEYELSRSADNAPLVEAVPLAALMAQLNGMGLKLGVMTNDSEQSARSHLGRSGVHDAFRHIIGFDSGHGAKPAPGPLLAFAAAVDISPERIVMVGDSPHDLEAGRAAGMQTVAVLTGPIGIERLAPIADSVLPDIGHLPDWIVTAP